MDLERRLRELEEELERCRRHGRLLERRLRAVLGSRTWRLSSALGAPRRGWRQWLRLPADAARALWAAPAAAASSQPPAQPGWPRNQPLLSVAVLPGPGAVETVQGLLASSLGDVEIFATDHSGLDRVKPLEAGDLAAPWRALDASGGKYLACLAAGARVDRTWAEQAVLALENRLETDTAAADGVHVWRRSASRPPRVARLLPGLVRQSAATPAPPHPLGAEPPPPWPAIDWPKRGLSPFSTQKPSLLIATAWLGGGGAERIALDLLDLDDEFELALAATAPGPREWADRFRARTPWVYGLSEVHPRPVEALISLVELHRPQGLLLSSTEEGYRALAALRSRFPSLWIGDILHNDAPEGRLADSVGADDFLDLHFAVSERVAETLARRGVARSKIVIAPNGVDVERLTPELRRERRAAARRRFGCAEGEFTLAYVGRLSEEKDPFLFVDAVAWLLRERPRAPLRALMAGDGPERFAVENLLEDRGLEDRVLLLGWQEDSVEVFAAADLFMLTSRTEGAPLTLLEAMSLGCPVVAARVGGVEKIVIGGEGAWLPARRDPAAFGRAVAEALDAPSKGLAFAEAARRRVVAEHSRERMLAAYRQALLAGLAGARAV